MEYIDTGYISIEMLSYSCCENKLMLVLLRVERVVPVRRGVNLLILAGGVDSPSPSSKSIRSRSSPLNPSKEIVKCQELKCVALTPVAIWSHEWFGW